MANLRQSYGAIQFANLDWQEGERPVDRLAAAGAGISPLGLLLWRAVYSLESASYDQFQRKLVEIYRQRYRSEPPDRAVRVCWQVLREYVNAACAQCRGRGEVLHSDKLVACPSCAGVKVRRYSDKDRAHAMQLSMSTAKLCAPKITYFLGFLTDLDRDSNVAMNVQLDRD